MEYSKKINGVDLNYKRTGQGAPVVLLHGWGCDLKIFENMHKSLEPNFEVYALDLPGFGRSTPPEKVWGVEEYTACIEAFFKQEGIRQPTLIGHSFGGRISILFASRNPVRKLILVDSAGVLPQRELKYYFKVYLYKAIKKTLNLFLGTEKAENILNKYRKNVGSSDYQNASGIMRQILVKAVNEDLKEVMPDIKVPTLLMWGENDTATPVRDAEIMKQLIPNAGLVVFKNAGHYSFIDKSVEFLIVLNNFLVPDKS